MAPPSSVVVHPLVLLSVVDHYNRVAKDSKKRVVGVLLGETRKGRVDIMNSYAVPFEEDAKSPEIWFLDHNYHETMFEMFKKVSAREKVVGWYSTGPLIRPSDLEINELMRRYTPEPILCIIDVNPKDNLEIPTQAYISVENAPEAQAVSRRTFAHIPSEIGAEEAEEVGVEHLLRNIHDTSQSTLTDQVQQKLASLHSLKNRMADMIKYLDNVIQGKCPPNHQIIYNIQDILNLCPDLQSKEMVESLAITNNDNMLVIYLSSLIRSILALDDLINNKLRNQALENEDAEGDKKEENKNEKKDDKSGEKKDEKGEKKDDKPKDK